MTWNWLAFILSSIGLIAVGAISGKKAKKAASDSEEGFL